ncbi:MAG: adenylate/guanylate cyclase domain-containing protein [Cyanobacteria bacterium J06642_9]
MQSSLGLLKSRLSRQIVAWVFFSLLTIEGIIFVPSYFRRQRQELRDLEQLSQEVLVTVKSNMMVEMAPETLLASALAERSPDSVILGAVLYSQDGQEIDRFDEAPTLSFEAIDKQGILRQLGQNGTRYDVAWPSARFQGRYVLVVRHDATQVKRSMQQYAIAIAGLVIIISLFVTFVTITVLERILINPLLYLRDDLMLAAEAIKQDQPPQFRSLAQPRQDELGEVTRAFGEMFERIAQEIREREAAEAALRDEQEKSESLLLNVLPAAIATRLKNNLSNRGAIADSFGEVTILFADIVGFTELATKVKPTDLVCQLNTVFSAFDGIAERYGVEKIKTIGDAYMAVGGVPNPMDNHAEAVAHMAIEMQQSVQNFCSISGHCFRLRIGIHTGPVVAGVIGVKKFSYDLWGDTVNIASRMESHGVVDRIQVSSATYRRLKDTFAFEDRGCIALKGRGEMRAYLLKGPSTRKQSIKGQSKP